MNITVKNNSDLDVIKKSYNSDNEVKRWCQIAERQHCRDKVILQTIIPYLKEGVTLEIGAGVGQISTLLCDLGMQVVASDYSDKFVSYMKTQDLPAIKADATALKKALLGCQPDNVYAQGISTLIQPNCEGLKESYQSVYDVLNPRGRFIVIHPNHRQWNRLEDHVPVFSAIGFKVVKIWRQQIIPSRFYCYFPKKIILLLENTLGRLFGRRNIIVLEK